MRPGAPPRAVAACLGPCVARDESASLRYQEGVTTIRTPRLLLRRARPEDLDALFVVLSDPETMRYWSTPPHATRETTRAWLAKMLDASEEESEDFVVEHEGEVVGKVGFYRLPEIGFVLRRDLWGRGLMTEAASAAIAHVWATRDVDEMRADADPRNAASRALLTKLGFVETGFAERTFEIAGEWVDSVYYALPRPSGLRREEPGRAE